NKACAQLSLGEAIFLAGLPQAPSRFNPWYRLELAMAKYERSLKRLRELAFITEEQERQLRAYPPRPDRYVPEHRWPHFLEAAQQSRENPIPGGLIRTTLDPSIQSIGQRLLEGHLNGL